MSAVTMFKMQLWIIVRLRPDVVEASAPGIERP
jgi:hypothetical protein